MKCALAHILPDGRVINTKSLQLQKNHHNQKTQQQRLMNGGPVGPNDIFMTHAFAPNNNVNNINNINNSNNSNISTTTTTPSTQGPTTSATIRNIYISAASAAYNGSGDYTQNLSLTPTSSVVGNQSSSILISNENKPGVPNMIGEGGPIVGSVPLIHHHKAASFIIPPTDNTNSISSPSFSSPTQQQKYIPSQSFSASSAALHQHRQQILPLQQGQFQRPISTSFSNGSTSGSIWHTNNNSNSSNNNNMPGVNISSPSSIRQNSVSVLANSFSNVQINNHQEFLENHEFAIDDDDDGLEDFVPSSLTDLLTEKERQRRGSRPSSSTHPVFNGVNTRASFSNATPDIWASSSPRTFARRHHLGDIDGMSLNGDSVTSYGSPLRSSFSVSNSSSNNVNTGSAATSNNININNNNSGTPLQPPIGTPDGTSFMSSYKNQALMHSSSHQSKSSLLTGVGSSVLSDDGVTGVLTPNGRNSYLKEKSEDDYSDNMNSITPTVAHATLASGNGNGYSKNSDSAAASDNNSLETGSPTNEVSEFDETQFEMDEEVPKNLSKVGLVR